MNEQYAVGIIQSSFEKTACGSNYLRWRVRGWGAPSIVETICGTTNAALTVARLS